MKQIDYREDLAKRIEEKAEKPMILLALSIIPVLLVELGVVTTNQYYMSVASRVNDLIWFVFLFEYLLLVSLYSDKMAYTRKNWFNVLVIIITPPVVVPSSFASVRALRALRALRFLRVMISVNRGVKPVFDTLTRNSFHHVTLITAIIITISGIIFAWLENRGAIEGIWWAITTVTTVGYGDLYPSSIYGRFFAVFLMVIGIAFVSMLTGNIASYFVAKDACECVSNENIVSEYELIMTKLNEISGRIDDLDEKILKMDRKS